MNTYKPSDFAALGHPSCSWWGKTEIECIALAYVQALVADGDEWKRLTKQQVHDLLTPEQHRRAMNLISMRHDYYDGWFDSVADRITNADGALSVGGFWNERRLLQRR